MRLRGDSPGAVKLRAEARRLFPAVDAGAARAQARAKGSRLEKLASDVSGAMSSTYRFELAAGVAPAGLLIQASCLGSDPSPDAPAGRAVVEVGCFPHPVEPLVELLRALGHPEAAARGEPAKAIVFVDGQESAWHKAARPATEVAKLILDACLWEEDDSSFDEADDMRALIPDPPAPAPPQNGKRKRRPNGPGL